GQGERGEGQRDHGSQQPAHRRDPTKSRGRRLRRLAGRHDELRAPDRLVARARARSEAGPDVPAILAGREPLALAVPAPAGRKPEPFLHWPRGDDPLRAPVELDVVVARPGDAGPAEDRLRRSAWDVSGLAEE